MAENGGAAGAVRVTESVDGVKAEQRNDVIALVGVGAVALLLGLVVAWLLAGSLAKPMRGLAATAGRVAHGDLDARASVEGSAEQREVATAFNDMTGRMASTLRGQREFVANASHQLRTPLTGLRLRLEAAALKSRDPEVERELTAAEHETERLARLLSELLTLAGGGERPTAQPLDVAGVIDAARGRWEGPAERSDHELRVEPGPPVVVAASAEDLAAILDNLTENALNYSPPGSTVTLTWASDGETVRLAVLDEGPGLDSGEGERVFQRFYRGSASRGGASGTGLGLAVAEALAARWGGEVALTNRPEGGARAEVRWPPSALYPELTLSLTSPCRGEASLGDDDLQTLRNRRSPRHRRPPGRGGHRPARELDLGRQRGPLRRAAERRGDTRAEHPGSSTGPGGAARGCSAAGPQAPRRRPPARAARGRGTNEHDRGAHARGAAAHHHVRRPRRRRQQRFRKRQLRQGIERLRRLGQDRRRLTARPGGGL